jgi:polysaccharide export outer membrane protein
MGSSLLVWLTLLAQPAQAAPAAQTPTDKQAESPSPAPTPEGQQATPAAPDLLPEYVIGPGDGLQLFVWKEGELTRELKVRIDGRITVPLLGDLVADGKTPMQLASELTTELGRFVEAPLVNVIVGAANSAKIFVIGEVKNTGALEMIGRMTILHALAMSGGFAQFANTDDIVVIRGRETIKVNYDKIKDGKDLSQNLMLQAGDTIVVR